MLKYRLIPTLLLKNGRMIKTINFDKGRDVGNPVTAAKVYDSQGVDELIFLDIDASVENRGLLLNIIARVADECFMPLTVGGGIRTIADIRDLLKVGADKIAINTIAVKNSEFIAESSGVFGKQCIVVSIDYKLNNAGKNEVFTHGGKRATGLDPIDWAKKVEQLGAGEILLYSIDRDGTMKGYDIEMISKIAGLVSIPVIACGGAGNLQDLVDVIKIGKASAVAAASLFHFTDQSPIKARSFMWQAGLNVRHIYAS